MAVPVRIDIEAPFVLTKPLGDEHEFYDLVDEDAPWELLDGKLVMSPASDRPRGSFQVLLTLFSGDLASTFACLRELLG